MYFKQQFKFQLHQPHNCFVTRCHHSTASGTDTAPSSGAVGDAVVRNQQNPDQPEKPQREICVAGPNADDADESRLFLKHCVFLFDQARTILSKVRVSEIVCGEIEMSLLSSLHLRA